MRRNWRGRYRGNWYRGAHKRNNNTSSDSRSLNNSTSASGQLSTSASLSRAPANQLPIVVAINTDKTNVWKLYFPSEGL